MSHHLPSASPAYGEMRDTLAATMYVDPAVLGHAIQAVDFERQRENVAWTVRAGTFRSRETTATGSLAIARCMDDSETFRSYIELPGISQVFAAEYPIRGMARFAVTRHLIAFPVPYRAARDTHFSYLSRLVEAVNFTPEASQFWAARLSADPVQALRNRAA